MDGLAHECWSKRVSAVEQAAERWREPEDLRWLRLTGLERFERS